MLLTSGDMPILYLTNLLLKWRSDLLKKEDNGGNRQGQIDSWLWLVEHGQWNTDKDSAKDLDGFKQLDNISEFIPIGRSQRWKWY